MQRRILHVDMDEFFAAVEKLDFPELRGRCLLVGGQPSSRGVVATASYEARKFGCRSAMPMATAVRLCPQAIIRPPRMERYCRESERVFDIFHRFTPLVEPLSIDEAFLDVTGCERLFGPAEQIAARLKQAVADETHLPCSVGVAPNKFLAKLASDLRKPDALVVIAPEAVYDVLDPLPVTKIWGVGPAAEKQLSRHGIRTVGQLRAVAAAQLRRWFGEAGEHFHRLANGQDDRDVTPDSRAKSIGQEQTFAADVGEMDELRRVLIAQAEQVARRLRRGGLRARTVTLKLRYGDFTTLTRSATLERPTDVTQDVLDAALALLATWARTSLRPLRLLGVTASGLRGTGGSQLSLFEPPDAERHRRLDRAMDDIHGRFGDRAVRRGPPADEE